MSILVIAEHRQGALRDITAEMAGAAVALGAGPVAVAVLAGTPGPRADAPARGGGGEVVEGGTPADRVDSHLWRAAVEALVADRSPRAVLVAHSVDGMSFGPAVAATQGRGLATDVVALEVSGDGLVATRAPYGGKVDATVATSISGTSCRRRSNSRKNRCFSGAVVYCPRGSGRRAKRTLFGFMPRSTVCRATKLRISKPAPASNMSDSATSTITSAPRSLPPRNPPLVPLPESFSGSTMSRLAVRKAGSKPNSTAVNAAVTRLKIKTVKFR